MMEPAEPEGVDVPPVNDWNVNTYYCGGVNYAGYGFNRTLLEYAEFTDFFHMPVSKVDTQLLILIIKLYSADTHFFPEVEVRIICRFLLFLIFTVALLSKYV